MKNNTTDWLFKNEPIKEISDMPYSDKVYGFVYVIINKTNNHFYIGRKSLYSKRKTKIGIREKTKTKTRKRFKQVIKESNWKNYYGSSERLQEDIKKLGKENFKRIIVEFAYNKKYLGFAETEHLFKHDVLRLSNSYNTNIMGKYFPEDMLHVPNEPIIKKIK